MSNDTPTITVTRGKRSERSQKKKSTSAAQSQSSSGLGLPGSGALVSGLVRSVRSAWWAGLGMLAVARDAGSKIFDALVEEGKSWEQARREQAKERVRQLRRLANEGGAVEDVEERVREDVHGVLQRIGVPHRDDLEELHEQIDALGEKIEHLSQAVEETRDL